MAVSLNVSQTLIGLTIVAIGTSLPELATTVVARTGGHKDVAVGNVIGSNIFNIFWILGITSIIAPIPFSNDVSFDILVGIGASYYYLLLCFLGRSARQA